MGKLNNFCILHNVFNHYHRINIDWNKIPLNKRRATLNFVLSEAIQPFSDYVLIQTIILYFLKSYPKFVSISSACQVWYPDFSSLWMSWLVYNM
jgi:hypothetical protein